MEYRFSAERLAQLANMEEKHFWFAGRRKLVGYLGHQYLDPSGLVALDIGCGTGSMLHTLHELRLPAVGLDGRIEGIRSLHRRYPSLNVVQGDALHLPVKRRAAYGVLMLDTLEHVDDTVALREVWRVLRSNGHLILSVPAVKWLWGFRDIDAGHLRRYSRQDMFQVLRENGFAVEYLQYYQFLLFPMLLVSRLIGKITRTARDTEDLAPGLINNVFRAIVMFEVGLSIRGIRWPWGSSLIIVARKVA